jgi:hypothetical protein
MAQEIKCYPGLDCPEDIIPDKKEYETDIPILSSNHELNYWKETKKCNKFICYKNFLSRYPYGKYEHLARKKLKSLDPSSNKIKLMALVIGNSEYKNAFKLLNPKNDAMDVSDLLETMGFNVTKLINLPKNRLLKYIDEYYLLSKNKNKNTIYLTYYSGHSFFSDGKQYIMPVDAKKNDSNEFIPLLNITPNHFGIKSANDFFLYSTKFGGVSFDGNKTNSPFTKALLQGFEKKDLSLHQVFMYVRNTVKQKTHNSQVPWMSVSADNNLWLSKVKNGYALEGGSNIVILDSSRNNPFKKSN